MSLDTQNRRQFVDYRVCVYRLHLDGTFTLKNGREVAFDTLFNADYGDQIYTSISETLNDTASSAFFTNFLNSYAKSLSAGLFSFSDSANADDMLVQNGGPLEEIDITPLVRSVGTKLVLAPPSTCSIAMFDPQLSDLTKVELERYGTLTRSRAAALDKLRSFRLREFDLVRVYAYSEIEKSPAQKLTQMSVQGKGVFADNLQNRFLQIPAFTGLVNTITRGNSVGEQSVLNVECLGLHRMFMQSVSIFNEGLADVLKQASSGLTILDNSFEVSQGKFGEQSADTIFTKLVNDYLIPRVIADGNNNPMMGVPDVDRLMSRFFPKDGVARFYPMLPTVVLIHLLKKRFGEPIFRIDDRVNPNQTRIRSTTGYPFEHVTTSADMSKAMQPYVLMFRDSFSLYTSEYKSAEEVFEDIRGASYMEIYEDRTGEIHFRFPRFNCIDGMAIIDPADVHSVVHTRSDSAIFTADVAQITFPISGDRTLVPGQTFLDKFSTFKFGFRRPQTSANPNALSDSFAQALAKFSCDYHAMKDARMAEIVKVGDPKLNVGQMALFRIRRNAKPSSSEANSDSIDDVMAGYIVEIDESWSVGGQYTQTLHLAFVRPAAALRMQYTDMSVEYLGTAWDVASMMPKRVVTTGPSKSPYITQANLDGPMKSNGDTGPFLYSMSINAPTLMTFRRVADPWDLALVAARSKDIQDRAFKSAISRGDISAATVPQVVEAIKSVKDLIEHEQKILQLIAIRNAIINDFLQGTPSPSSLMNILGGNSPSPAEVRAAASLQTYSSLNSAGLGLQQAFKSAKQKNIKSSAGSGLSQRELDCCIDWDSMFRYVSESQKGLSRPSEPQFVDLWNSAFSNSSGEQVTARDRRNGMAALDDMNRQLILLVKNGEVAIQEQTDLNAAKAQLKDLQDALAKAKSSPKSQAPAEAPAIPRFLRNSNEN